METLLEVFSEENRVIFMMAFFNIKKIELTEKKDMLINLMLVKPGRSQLILMAIDRLPKEMKAEFGALAYLGPRTCMLQ